MTMAATTMAAAMMAAVAAAGPAPRPDSVPLPCSSWSRWVCFAGAGAADHR
jgi:hypothetical protein